MSAKLIDGKAVAETIEHEIREGAARLASRGIRPAKHGDTFDVGGATLRVVHTPGHTPGSQCFHVEHRLVAGDTLKNLEAIAAVEGIDGVFIGPADLHASLGYLGETNNPKIVPVIDDAIRRIRKAGKAPGILTGVEADAKHWLEVGALFVEGGRVVMHGRAPLEWIPAPASSTPRIEHLLGS
mgnify:CR=1 FL=1